MKHKEAILNQMKFHELQALWWMHSASNGHAITRNIQRMDGHKLTDKELISEAMEISQNHLRLFNEYNEKLMSEEYCEECGGTDNEHYLNCSFWQKMKNK